MKTLPVLSRVIWSLAISAAISAGIPARAENGAIAPPNVLECLEDRAVYKPKNPDVFDMARWVEVDSEIYFLHGLLGWHVTWAVILDQSETPARAFETINSPGEGRGAVGRAKTPPAIIIALQKCGVSWMGDWMDPLPTGYHIVERLKAPAPGAALNLNLDLEGVENLLPPLRND